MNLEEIEEKYVNTPVSMEQAEKLLTDYLPILIAEVKRLREENTALRNDKERIEFENNQFRRYVIETGCSYTQTESDCECDYEYPWPCDHCPIVEHNRTIDAEMEAEK